MPSINEDKYKELEYGCASHMVFNRDLVEYAYKDLLDIALDTRDYRWAEVLSVKINIAEGKYK